MLPHQPHGLEGDEEGDANHTVGDLVQPGVLPAVPVITRERNTIMEWRSNIPVRVLASLRGDLL